MEQKIFNCYKKIEENKLYAKVTAILFPLLLVLVSFVNVNKGIDITDTTYSCVNFRFLDDLNSMWYYSIFYSNLFGRLLSQLPGGATLLGMYIYTTVIKASLAVAAYLFFAGFVKLNKELVFLSCLTAVCLCWCPTTIVYNYLSYLLFFLTVMFLLMGLKKEKAIYLLLAGFCLGTNVFVRLPNICEAALILVVFLNAFFKKSKAGEWIKKTLLCMGGFFAAFIPALILILVTRGLPEYVSGITDLFTMTDTDSSYSTIGMVMSIIKSYIHAWTWLELVILLELMILLGCLVLPTKLNPLRYLVSAAITVWLVISLYKKSLFSFDYNSYGSIYGLGKIILCLAILTFIVALFNRKESNDNRLLAFAGLIIIGITPLGTNNEIYANLNNMFFVLPVFVALLCRFVSTNEHLRGVRFSILLITAFFALQSILFGMNFRFRDGEKAPMNTKVTNNQVVAGIYTTADNARLITELSRLWEENSFSTGTVLLYGNVSGLGYVMNTKTAISTPWPSLPSFTKEKLTEDIGILNEKIAKDSSSLPVVVIGSEEIEGVLKGATPKQEILKEFLEKYNYMPLYNSERLSVYCAK